MKERMIECESGHTVQHGSDDGRQWGGGLGGLFSRLYSSFPTHPRAVNVDFSPESLGLSLERGTNCLANGFRAIVTNYPGRLEPCRASPSLT